MSNTPPTPKISVPFFKSESARLMKEQVRLQKLLTGIAYKKARGQQGRFSAQVEQNAFADLNKANADLENVLRRFLTDYPGGLYEDARRKKTT